MCWFVRQSLPSVALSWRYKGDTGEGEGGVTGVFPFVLVFFKLPPSLFSIFVFINCSRWGGGGGGGRLVKLWVTGFKPPRFTGQE